MNWRNKIESRRSPNDEYRPQIRNSYRMSQSQNQSPTYEEVVAMRSAADSAERTFNKIGTRLAHAENVARYFESELIVAKRNKKNPLRVDEVRKERDDAVAEKDAVEMRWYEQLELHDRLWSTYCQAHAAFQIAEAKAKAKV